MSIARLAAATLITGAAMLTLGTTAATADIPLDPPAPQLQTPQPISGFPSSGSFGATCTPTNGVIVC
ncbi:hypothetical protein VMT65_06240 [Nocardia sp. CDC153]|uniref:hypothetical protein n=1 Tax=Nocardia sp. CDC153 TaxID=3112167 RepID=UPI002DBEBCC0|nr:hypothetical protein [Nocardia sp. CDC153]MEC3952623.1 hypothetical protein [Nocardia sp. CDC153]